MKAKTLSLVLFLAFAGSMAAAAVRYADPSGQQTVPESDETPIPRVVVAEKRSKVPAEDCESVPARVVVSARREKAG